MPRGVDQRQPKIRPTDEPIVPLTDHQWESDSSIGLDEGVIEGVGRAQGIEPVGRQTRQAVHKQAISKVPQPSRKRWKMDGKNKEKATPSTAPATKSASDKDRSPTR